MIIVIIIEITVIVIVITIKVVVLIITIIMALCSHDHVPCSTQESHDWQCPAFLVELIENHDCDQMLILITPNYCNTAANDPSAIQYKRSSLVLYRLLMLPLSGALYVTFNSVQIDFVYFILIYVVPKSTQQGGSEKEAKGCIIDKAAAKGGIGGDSSSSSQ